MASDFHTHPPKRDRPENALYSLPFPISREDAALHPRYSLQFHPWDLPARKDALPPGFADALEAADALGEVGLDRLRGPELSIQRLYLKELLTLAEKQKKPVVFHVVRAWPEFLALASGYPFRKLVHGFLGSPKRLQELLDCGFFVSLSPRIFSVPGITELLKQSDWTHLGFESDASGIPVTETIRAAEQQLNRSDLEAKTDAAFLQFTGE